MSANELRKPHVSSRKGLPPRDRNADMPEQANNGTIWMGGIIALCALVALIMFGGSGHQNTASSSLNSERGMTTGAAPTRPSETPR